MKKKLLLLLSVLAVCTLVGCGSKDDPVIQTVEPEPLVSEEVTEEVEEEKPFQVITERKVVDGKMQSYLTGEWKDEAVVKRRSMALMVPNNQAAMPQYGISKASIIYEAPVEGRISRLMLFVEDYDELDHIGPARSSRDYYVYEAMAYDAIYCNWGLAVPYVEELLKSDRIDNVSQAVLGIHNAAPEAYDRIPREGYATEYTGYLFIDGYEKAVKRLGYETEYRDTFEQAFTFADEGCRAKYEDMEDATKIYPGGDSSNRSGYGQHRPWFEYDEEEGVYYRYQYGEPQIDEYNNEHLSVSNVIFKYCEGEVRDANDYLIFGVHGEGDALVFTNGKVIKGTWKRESDTAANMFYDEDGNEIYFNQGKTWICNIWTDYAEFATYE